MDPHSPPPNGRPSTEYHGDARHLQQGHRGQRPPLHRVPGQPHHQTTVSPCLHLCHLHGSEQRQQQGNHSVGGSAVEATCQLHAAERRWEVAVVVYAKRGIAAEGMCGPSKHHGIIVCVVTLWHNTRHTIVSTHWVVAGSETFVFRLWASD